MNRDANCRVLPTRSFLSCRSLYIITSMGRLAEMQRKLLEVSLILIADARVLIIHHSCMFS